MDSDAWKYAVGAGGPLLLSLVFWRANRRAERAAAAREKVVVPRGGIRGPLDTAPGKAIYRVRVPRTEGVERTNLGTSVEVAASISGHPDLTSAAFRAQTEAGLTIAVQAGATLKVREVSGARRNLLESVTTASGGIEQRFSFEVGEETSFLIEGVVPERPAGSPFRQGDDVELQPGADGSYAVNPHVAGYTSLGCLLYPALALAAALPVGTLYEELAAFWQYSSWIAWTALMALGLLLSLSPDWPGAPRKPA